VLVQVANHVFAITTSALHSWQKVEGTLRVRANAWGARTTGIGLYIDGRAVSRDRTAPYTLRWNTRRVRDGAHALSLVAESVDRRVARRSLTVVVSNRASKATKTKTKTAPKRSAPPRIVSENLVDGQTVAGAVDWRAHTLGPVARVEFVVDGTVVATETREPWQTSWDATAASGAHTLEVRAYTRDGQVATRTVTVTVTPPPAPSAPSP
jgi:chitinase